MERRGFLQAILAAGVAPAFVGSGILMPVRKIWTPRKTYAVITEFSAGPYTSVFNTPVSIEADEQLSIAVSEDQYNLFAGSRRIGSLNIPYGGKQLIHMKVHWA